MSFVIFMLAFAPQKQRIVIPTHKLGRFFLCVCCVLVRCVWVFAGCVCVQET